MRAGDKAWNDKWSGLQDWHSLYYVSVHPGWQAVQWQGAGGIW